MKSCSAVIRLNRFQQHQALLTGLVAVDLDGDGSARGRTLQNYIRIVDRAPTAE
jgi:hypothetical protein